MTDEPLLTWKGRRVRSAEEGPEAVARKVPEAPRPGSLFFVPSPLEGWGLDVLLDRLPEDCVVLIYEKDPELETRCSRAFSEFLGQRSQDPRLFHLRADTEEEVQRTFRRLPRNRLRRCEFLPLNGAWMAHGPRYRQLFTRFDQGLMRWWTNRITCLHMGPLWVKNLFDNLRAREFRPRPWPHWGQALILVCGAGVTLESVLPWAGVHRGQIRILAADTALPVLKAGGLVPDAVVCLESQHANLRDFSGWKGADVALFADVTSYPPGTRVLGGLPYWFCTEFAELNLWNRLPWTPQEVPRLPPLGSVGVAAAWIAWRLTQGPVILAGLDFSFPLGKTHARGSPSLATLAARTNRLSPPEQVGIWERPGMRQTDGGWLTTPVMEGYAQVLADQAQGHSHRTWTWSNQGLPLGLPLWPHDQGPPESRPFSQTESAPPEDRGAPQPVGWLQEEQEVWRTILEDFQAINDRPEDDLAWAAIETHLAMVDYLTFAFPDPEFRRDSDWLVRAQVQVRWILERTSRPRRT